MGLFSHRTGLAAAFVKCVNSTLQGPGGTAAQLLQCYGITPDLDGKAALLSVLQFGSDIGHQAPSRALAASFPGEDFVMEFAEPNPWDGPIMGHSTHILDIYFLLHNFNDFLDMTQRAGAEQFAKNIIAFSYCQKPWESYPVSRGISRLEGGEKEYLDGTEAMAGRFRELLKFGQVIRLDILLGIWVNFVFDA